MTETPVSRPARFRIGIIFNFNPSWMGGIIYILNLIKTLNYLDDTDKPHLLVFYRKDLGKYLNEIDYPYLEVIEWTFPGIYAGYLKSWFSCTNQFVNKIIDEYEPDALYPLHDFPVRDRKGRTRLVSWYADLQHKYYPEFFTRQKLIERSLRIRFILRNAKDLVVSSNAVKSDFMKFFNPGKNPRIHVYHFVSVTGKVRMEGINDLLKKYGLPEKYFIVSNQFHRHKNHRVILKAMAILKEEGHVVNFVMTGRLPSERDSEYMAELYSIIDKSGLGSQVFFTGVVPRDEQLMLMKHSQAVVQPSLFEGWSTVIEDAMAVQVPVIASDITVNREQLGERGIYFEKENHSILASVIRDFSGGCLKNLPFEDYETRIKSAAIDFMEIIRGSESEMI